MSESDSSSSVNALLEQLRKANGESADRRAKLRTLKAQLDELTKAHEALKAEKATIEAARVTLETERNDWKAKYDAGPEGAQVEINRLKAEVRIRDHRDAFKGLYDEKSLAEDGSIRLNPAVSPDRLMQILGYKPESDQPDLAQIKAAVLKARESDPYLFEAAKAAAPGGPGTPPATPPALPPGPGTPRGGPDHDAGGLKVTRAQMRDPEWMRANQPKMAIASKEGRLTIEAQTL